MAAKLYIFLKTDFICVSTFLACMYMSHMYVVSKWSSQEDTGFPETRVIDGYVSPVGAGN